MISMRSACAASELATGPLDRGVGSGGVTSTRELSVPL